MTNFVSFNIYEIGIQHPQDWQVFISPNNRFTFNEGLIKIDRVTVNKTKAASLSVRWGGMKEKIELYDYVEELDANEELFIEILTSLHESIHVRKNDEQLYSKMAAL